jgi:hypothetical protein
MTIRQYLMKACQDDARRAGERDRLLLEARRARAARGQRPDPAAPPKRLAQLPFRRVPRLPRWIIVAGIILLAGSIAATVIARPVSLSAPRPAPGYLLAAHDAHFTALFPRKPLRTEKTAETTTVIVYLADLPGYAVGIICAPVPASGRVRLDRAVNVAASALPGGDVVSRHHRLTYHGQPAEDAAISVLGEPGQIRIVVFGSSAYIFEGFGATAASFAHDYQILLDTFTPHPYDRTTG